MEHAAAGDIKDYTLINNFKLNLYKNPDGKITKNGRDFNVISVVAEYLIKIDDKIMGVLEGLSKIKPYDRKKIRYPISSTVKL